MMAMPERTTYPMSDGMSVLPVTRRGRRKWSVARVDPQVRWFVDQFYVLVTPQPLQSRYWREVQFGKVEVAPAFKKFQSRCLREIQPGELIPDALETG